MKMMNYNRGTFALKVILDLYKAEKISFVEAIKLIRGVFKIGLKDSKDIMDMVRKHFDE